MKGVFSLVDSLVVFVSIFCVKGLVQFMELIRLLDEVLAFLHGDPMPRLRSLEIRATACSPAPVFSRLICCRWRLPRHDKSNFSMKEHRSRHTYWLEEMSSLLILERVTTA